MTDSDRIRAMTSDPTGGAGRRKRHRIPVMFCVLVTLSSAAAVRVDAQLMPFATRLWTPVLELPAGDPSPLVVEVIASPATIGAGPALLPRLREALDPQLQTRLEAYFKSPAMTRAIREKRLAAAVVDITDINAPRLAMINGDTMIYAASLPKIAILLGTFELAARGELELNAERMRQATRMIRNSSNTAATNLYFAVGPQRLARILQSEQYRLYDPVLGGGLWVGKPYANRQTWKRDPLANLSHGATAFQTARFFYLLETGQLVSPEASAQMKQILGKPAIRHKFVRGLDQSRPGSAIFRKSGTWRTYHADAGIVERDGRRYIAVILANDPAGPAWLRKLIVNFDDLIHGDQA